MFKNQMEHEGGLIRPYHENVRGKGPSFAKKMQIKRNGGKWCHDTPHFDRKKRKCYPRGKAWLRMVDLHSIAYLESH